jgi:hypothetical protein
VSAEFERLADLINMYDPHLFLEMIPDILRADLNDQSKVFRVVDDRNNSIVLYASSVANPTEILTRIFNMDGKHGNVMDRMDAENAAKEALANYEKMEQRGIAMEFAEFVFRNQKSRWVHDGRVRDEHFRDLGPVRTHIT